MMYELRRNEWGGFGLIFAGLGMQNLRANFSEDGSRLHCILTTVIDEEEEDSGGDGPESICETDPQSVV